MRNRHSQRELQEWRTVEIFISDQDLTEWLWMQTAHSSVQYKYRPDDISLSISVRPACGSALMPRQGPPGYKPYTWGSGINYQPASLKQGA